MKKFLLNLLMVNAILTIKPMQVPRLPADMKLEIAQRIVQKRSLEEVINSLESLSLVDRTFYKILSAEFKPFFKLYKTKNPIEALKLVYKYNLRKYPDWAHYLHKKFPYLPLEEFPAGYAFTVEWALPDLQKIFPPTNTNLSKAIQENNIVKVFRLLLLGADKDGKDSSGLTPLVNAIRQNNENIVQLLIDAGADTSEFLAERLKRSRLAERLKQSRKEHLKGTGYISRRLLTEPEKGLKGIWKGMDQKWSLYQLLRRY